MLARSIASASVWLAALLAFARPARADPVELARIEEEERALRADPAKLRLRHHLEGLLRKYERAAAVGPSDRARALEGVARAARLLAHWSGRPEDRSAATSAETKATSARARAEPSTSRATRPQPPARQPAGRSAASELLAARVSPLVGPLKAVSVEVDGEQFRVLLGARGSIQVRSERILGRSGERGRTYFDLSPLAAEVGALKNVPIEHAGVARLRIGQFDPDTVRLVFDHQPGEEPDLRFVAASQTGTHEVPAHICGGEKGADLVSEARSVSGDEGVDDDRADDGLPTSPESAAADLAELVRDLTEKNAEPPAILPPEELEPLEPPNLEPMPSLNKSTKAALSSRSRSLGLVEIRRVVIDAGHGGKDHGARGRTGAKEKDVNLKVARALGDELSRRGMTVVYTRTTDQFVSLRRRAEIANRSGADLFISVHANAHKKRSVNGIETYYLNTTSSRYAAKLATRENDEREREDLPDALEPEVAVDSEEGTLPAGSLGRDLRILLADLAMRSVTGESRRLAGYVQSSLVSGLQRENSGVKDLGVKHALFAVLLGVQMPSVLIESGFLTHPEEERRLSDATYQRQVAKAIADGVRRFVQERGQLAARL